MWLAILGLVTGMGFAQEELAHKRGKLWDLMRNDGMYGSQGAWDFWVSEPIGLFPGFDGYYHPFGGEYAGENSFVNSSMHNFRSGLAVIAADLLTPGPPPYNTPTSTDYMMYHAGFQGDPHGVAAERDPLTFVYNYVEDAGYDPELPEEMSIASWHTDLGITITRRTYTWSFPGYTDFIIHDYVFKNTGVMISNYIGDVVPDFPHQDLSELYIAFHSAISVSTRSNINFYSDFMATQAGGFGWDEDQFHDFYHIFDEGELVFSTNWDGGKEPPPFIDEEAFPVKNNEAWKLKFGEEMQSPSAFGLLALYIDDGTNNPRASEIPDYLRVDDHKKGTFQGRSLDLERFNAGNRTPEEFYTFVTTPDTQAALGNMGDRFNVYTLSYGPYSLATNDSLRFVMAEIAGCMDYDIVLAGDPDSLFPGATIDAIRQNADYARQAVAWGMGGVSNGVPIAADVPDPPPGPTVLASNASIGADTALIAVTWDRIAELTNIPNGPGSSEDFYIGSDDLDGYRIYRSQDFQYVSDGEPPVLRGATWDLILDIPIDSAAHYWSETEQLYKWYDTNVAFGFNYGYYVAAYVEDPKPWHSANGTIVSDLGPLENGDYNRGPAANPVQGPVESLDVFAVPNPFVYNVEGRSFSKSDPYKIEFRNLPEKCTIRIYTLSGDLVAVLNHGPDEMMNLSGSTSWNQKSNSGLLVAPGLYIYHVESTTPGLKGSFTGKLMIVR
ncbi:MAG: hypothetical protein K9M49_09215 [Candidatus Marinimicrobia bacterium]|nr:hypothetical protein [Candidatus Neomarinimicrobiota bacterium]